MLNKGPDIKAFLKNVYSPSEFPQPIHPLANHFFITVSSTLLSYCFCVFLLRSIGRSPAHSRKRAIGAGCKLLDKDGAATPAKHEHGILPKNLSTFLQVHPVVRPCPRVTGPSPGSLSRIHLCPEAATDGTERERRVLGNQPSLSAAKAPELLWSKDDYQRFQTFS